MPPRPGAVGLRPTPIIARAAGAKSAQQGEALKVRGGPGRGLIRNPRDAQSSRRYLTPRPELQYGNPVEAGHSSGGEITSKNTARMQHAATVGEAKQTPLRTYLVRQSRVLLDASGIPTTTEKGGNGLLLSRASTPRRRGRLIVHNLRRFIADHPLIGDPPIRKAFRYLGNLSR